jgi:arylsulfatase A-like enzyme
MGRARPVIVLALLLAGFGCGRDAGRRPNVVLIVVDTLRADRLGSYGSTRGLTPFLDELAGRGVVFANAYASSSWTCPSVASLLTSRYPSQHGVVGFDVRLPEEETTLAERLVGGAFGRVGEVVRRDYVGGAFSANWRLMKTLGYAQGIRTWRSYATDRKPRADWLGRRCLMWLDGAFGWARWHRWFPRPLFLYLHFMEPHAPYDPPARHRPRDDGGADAATANRKLIEMRWSDLTKPEIALLERLYDGEVASFDAELRRLFVALEERGVLRDAVIVVTADHGEEFGEHGLMEHGWSLYEPGLRVPLIMVAPGLPAGRVVEEPVSLVDVAPTLLELLRLPAAPRFEGRSLLPLARERGEARDVLAELWPSDERGATRRHTLALIRARTKLLVGGDAVTTEAYDLASDPGETRPLEMAGAVGELRSVLAAKEADLRQRANATTSRVPLDERDRERLRALGYVE